MGFGSWQWQDILPFSKLSRLALVITQLDIQCVPATAQSLPLTSIQYQGYE
jgi:hypothetical protein